MYHKERREVFQGGETPSAAGVDVILQKVTNASPVRVIALDVAAPDML